jgi:hypothetical protein
MIARRYCRLILLPYVIAMCSPSEAADCTRFQATYAQLEQAVHETAMTSTRVANESPPSDADIAALCVANGNVIEYANSMLAFDSSCFPDDPEGSKAYLTHAIESANAIRALQKCSQ